MRVENPSTYRSEANSGGQTNLVELVEGGLVALVQEHLRVGEEGAQGLHELLLDQVSHFLLCLN